MKANLEIKKTLTEASTKHEVALTLPTVAIVRSTATPRGFEPLRAEPNGFRVHLLNRSDTVSLHSL